MSHTTPPIELLESTDEQASLRRRRRDLSDCRNNSLDYQITQNNEDEERKVPGSPGAGNENPKVEGSEIVSPVCHETQLILSSVLSADEVLVIPATGSDPQVIKLSEHPSLALALFSSTSPSSQTRSRIQQSPTHEVFPEPPAPASRDGIAPDRFHSISPLTTTGVIASDSLPCVREHVSSATPIGAIQSKKSPWNRWGAIPIHTNALGLSAGHDRIRKRGFIVQDLSDSGLSQFHSTDAGAAFLSNQPEGDINPCRIFVYGKIVEIPQTVIQDYECDVLMDVVMNSLAPLADQAGIQDTENVACQAALFFSAFNYHAQWYVDVDNLPPNIGRVIYGVTINSRNTDIGSRFIRFRFPHVFFEASQLMSVTPVATSGINTRVIWKAWARGGTTSGLVAYGIVSDEMIWHTQERKQVLKIVKRHFTVLQVQQPELFTPVPYPRQIPPLS